MPISAQMREAIEKSSWIRKMFEEGARLKGLHGADKVFDFSLGNPYPPPPEAFHQALTKEVAAETGGVHGYMPNNGFPAVRQSVADYISGQYGVKFTGDHIIMTCGAAGALNVVLKSILNPGDEIIAPRPYFVEYDAYVGNHNGKIVQVPTHEDFSLDTNAIAQAVTPKTAAVLINSPNNPTGAVYSMQNLVDLGRALEIKSREIGRAILLISDEPYRKILYDGLDAPSLFIAYRNSVVVTSYSKDLSLPGERIGYLALHPEADDVKAMLGAMTLANRILGFVNAPAMMQRVVARLQGVSVEVDIYRRKRDLLCDGLKDAGYQFIKPAGAFYLFPKSPIDNDINFVAELQKELILTVPGSGFMGPGYFRIAYCVDDSTITNALPGFKKVMDKYR
ncbi:MAG: pyridoxal phosphate-dependent aminotransferase [Deltaproteobacteria bacterium]|nr:pyridoxal phosphate-dependent aminotransferase [Deltaproteobacteria bacterium]